MILLKCCWGPTDYQIMQAQKNDDTILKELNGTYKINTLKGKDVSAFNLNITFNDSTNQVSGFSGCNRFFGSYTLDGIVLKFEALGTTKMACTEDKNEIESKFLKTFEKAKLVLFENNNFSLYNKKTLMLSASKEIKEISSIEYTASSRGIYTQIIIDKKMISVINKRGKKGIKGTCKASDWKRIEEAIKDLDIENMSEVEAPSKKFQFDGAALAHLKITHQDMTYESAPFDHGNPPKEIAALVKEILSISENIE